MMWRRMDCLGLDVWLSGVGMREVGRCCVSCDFGKCQQDEADRRRGFHDKALGWASGLIGVDLMGGTTVT